MRLVIVLGLALTGCGDGGEEYIPEDKPTLSRPEPLPTGAPVPPQTSLVCPKGTQLTWNNFAGGFVYDYCTSCHSSHVVGEQRAGAPETSNFDSAADVIVARGIILDKAVGASATMPPAGNVPAVEQELFAEWLNCGAPID